VASPSILIPVLPAEVLAEPMMSKTYVCPPVWVKDTPVDTPAELELVLLIAPNT